MNPHGWTRKLRPPIPATSKAPLCEGIIQTQARNRSAPFSERFFVHQMPGGLADALIGEVKRGDSQINQEPHLTPRQIGFENGFRLANHPPRMSYFGSYNVLRVNYKLTQCPHIDRLASPIFVI